MRGEETTISDQENDRSTVAGSHTGRYFKLAQIAQPKMIGHM